jgi:hypothetical protein
MVRSSLLILLFSAAGLVWGQEPARPAAAPGSIVRFRERQEAPRTCEVLQGWALPDGARAYRVQALDRGEVRVIRQGGLIPGATGRDSGEQRPAASPAGGQQHLFPPGTVFTLLDVGQPPCKCEVIKGWALPDGADVYQVWVLTVGEVMAVQESSPSSAVPGEMTGARLTPAELVGALQAASPGEARGTDQASPSAQGGEVSAAGPPAAGAPLAGSAVPGTPESVPAARPLVWQIPAGGKEATPFSAEPQVPAEPSSLAPGHVNVGKALGELPPPPAAHGTKEPRDQWVPSTPSMVPRTELIPPRPAGGPVGQPRPPLDAQEAPPSPAGGAG